MIDRIDAPSALRHGTADMPIRRPARPPKPGRCAARPHSRARVFTCLTDAERDELSRKVKKTNEDSRNGGGRR